MDLKVSASRSGWIRLFTELGKTFLEEEQKLYGTYGLYAADPFHESKPPVDTPEYLNAVGFFHP